MPGQFLIGPAAVTSTDRCGVASTGLRGTEKLASEDSVIAVREARLSCGSCGNACDDVTGLLNRPAGHTDPGAASRRRRVTLDGQVRYIGGDGCWWTWGGVGGPGSARDGA